MITTNTCMTSSVQTVQYSTVQTVKVNPVAKCDLIKAGTQKAIGPHVHV